MGIEQIRQLKSSAKTPKKKVYQIPKISAKKMAQKQAEKGKDVELENWFNERRKEMTGKCAYCGGKTEKNNNSNFKSSIAHIFPKRKNMYPSIATHPLNFLELCFYENSCHDNFDRNNLDFQDLINSPLKEELIYKVNVLYKAMEEGEKGKVPDNILKYINENI